MRQTGRWFAPALLLAGGCAAPAQRECAAIRELLVRQEAAWNRGDIAGFMDAYWRSEELSFSAGGKTTYGFDATRDGYERRYPTPERMGRLTFSELQVRLLGADVALVLGRWQLAREPDPTGGNFSLVLSRRAGRWRIIHDHTSTGPAGD